MLVELIVQLFGRHLELTRSRLPDGRDRRGDRDRAQLLVAEIALALAGGFPHEIVLR